MMSLPFVRKLSTIYQHKSIEINVVDHCNLTCNNCNHASPEVQEKYLEPSELYRQLLQLKLSYKSWQVKLIGGEPLLHPDLLTIVKLVKKSCIAKKILLVTNGTLLPKMSEEIWHLIDGLEISIYPTPGLSRKKFETYKALARRYNTRLNALYYPTFQVVFSSLGNDDADLVQRIFNTCKKAHLWHCHGIHHGYFYRCPQSIYIPQLLNLDDPQFENDRVKITGNAKKTKMYLRKFLASKQPLHACRYCLGDIGIEQPHELNPSQDAIHWNSVPVKQLVDYDYLKLSEQDITIQQKCRTLPDDITAVLRS